MGFYTSNKFASVGASGTDWRDTSRKVLEMLERARTENDNFNIGFIYITDSLVEDAQSILSLFRSVTGIEHWVGATGLGVCATGKEYIDGAAISAMIGRVEKSEFCVFPAIDPGLEPARAVLEEWMMGGEDPLLVLVHGDPLSNVDPLMTLSQLEQVTGGFIVGGMSSSRGAHIQIANEIMRGGICGVAFSQNIDVATTLTQGCAPLGPVHTVTRCDDNVLMELDGQRAFDVFAADLRAMAMEKTGQEIVPGEEGSETLGGLFKGEVHVAFPVAGSDQRDYLVRNALGIDPEKGWIAVAHSVESGDQMMFVHRDSETVSTDLSRSLIALRDRLRDERGVFDPKGALYISCVARTMSDFGTSEDDGTELNGGEMALVREIIGDVPLAGFFANGEISNCRLYGYTAVLILFF